MVDQQQKIYENRVRRMADRQNLRVIKVDRRDALAHDYGLWHLVRRFDIGATTARELRGSVDRRREMKLTPQPLPLAAIEKILLTPKAARVEQIEQAQLSAMPAKFEPEKVKHKRRFKRAPRATVGGMTPDPQMLWEWHPGSGAPIRGGADNGSDPEGRFPGDPHFLIPTG